MWKWMMNIYRCIVHLYNSLRSKCTISYGTENYSARVFVKSVLVIKSSINLFGSSEVVQEAVGIITTP